MCLAVGDWDYTGMAVFEQMAQNTHAFTAHGCAFLIELDLIDGDLKGISWLGALNIDRSSCRISPVPIQRFHLVFRASQLVGETVHRFDQDGRAWRNRHNWFVLIRKLIDGFVAFQMKHRFPPSIYKRSYFFFKCENIYKLSYVIV